MNEATTAGAVGPYRLGEPLGRGGSAMVYAATHPMLARPLALKLANRPSPRVAERFGREYQLLSQLVHDALPVAYDLGQLEDGRPWLVLDRVSGLAARTWANALGRSGCRARTLRVARLGARVARALADLHALELVHGDIKPGNLMIAPDGRPHLLDLGAALDLTAPTTWAAFGAGLGTGAYAAPEIVDRRHAEFGTGGDLYALGVTLYELVTGSNPFRAESREATKERQRRLVPPSLATVHTGTPRALSDLVVALLAKRRDARPASASEVADALEAVAKALPSATKAIDTPTLAPHRRVLGTLRGFFADAPPGQAALIDGATVAGLDAVFDRAVADAAALGLTAHPLDDEDDIAAAIPRPHKPALLTIRRLAMLNDEERGTLERALIDAGRSGRPLLLLAAREDQVCPPGPLMLSRRLPMLRCSIQISRSDYLATDTHLAGCMLRYEAFGGRWLEALGGERPGAPDDPLQRRVVALLDAVATPVPRAFILAALGAGAEPEAISAALVAGTRCGLLRGTPGARVAAFGALGARRHDDAAVAWDAALATLGPGEARACALVAAGRPEDAAEALLDAVGPPDDPRVNPNADTLACERVVPGLAALTTPAAVAAREVCAAWRRAWGPGTAGDPDAVPPLASALALWRGGRLGEARTAAEVALAATWRPAWRAHLQRTLEALSRSLGGEALGDAWAAAAMEEARRAGFPPPPVARVAGPAGELAAALASGDGPRALALARGLAVHLDPNDERRFWLRPELARLRAAHGAGAAGTP